MKESLKAIGKVQFSNVLKGKIVNVHYRKCSIDYSLKEESNGDRKFKISVVLSDKESEYNPKIYTVGLSSNPDYEKALSIIDKKVADYLSKLSIEDKVRIGYGDENPFLKDDKQEDKKLVVSQNAFNFNDNSLGLVLTGHESRRDLSNIFNKRLTMSIELQNGSKFVTALSILEIYNKELYKELGYSNLYDYTSDVFGMGKTNTNDYKNVALRFSKLDKVKNCLVIDEHLKDYNFSQLNLLKEVSIDTILKDYPCTLSVREIKDRLRNAMNFLEDNNSVDESVNDDLSDDTSEVLGGTADNIIDAMNNPVERYADDEKPYKTYVVTSSDFKKICLDKDKLHNYIDSITKELLKVLTESVDKYSEINICLLRKKGNELSDNSVDSDNTDNTDDSEK